MEPEDAVATTETSVGAALSPLPEINEGDTFFALATFVSETGEAMNLVEGEKVRKVGFDCEKSGSNLISSSRCTCLSGTTPTGGT